MPATDPSIYRLPTYRSTRRGDVVVESWRNMERAVSGLRCWVRVPVGRRAQLLESA